MDLRLPLAEPTEAERAAIDAVVGASEPGDGRVVRGDRHRRHLLLPSLRAAQRRVGWVSEGALGYASKRLDVPPADTYGVASFYALLALEERPRRCCTSAPTSPARSPARKFPPERIPSPCLGLCERAPASLRTVAGEAPREIQLPEAGPPLPQAGEDGLRLLRRIGAGLDPTSLDDYRAHGGYASLERALELGPEGVRREVSESKLLGRGGAAFPTGAKWEAVARQEASPHYLVCNADESEPGTFKDRVLMESDPFALVEAMTIAAYATGCERGFLYVRAEYPLVHERLEGALAQARAAGLLGDDVAGAGFAFDVELRIGAGAYVCGEETALFQSIEGYRGEPRNKPPFPVEVGLFGKPTVVNNVETLFNVLDVVAEGGAAYAATGTEGSTGTRLFCLSGHVERPGLYEVPFGTTLRALLDRAGARPAKAVLLGGAAGSFLRPDQLDLRAHLRGGARGRRDARLGRRDRLRRDRRPHRRRPADRRVLPRRVVRPVRPLPRRHRAPGGGAAPARLRRDARQRAGDARRSRAGDARRLDLRPRPDGRERRPVRDLEPRRPRPGGRPVSAVSVSAPKKVVELTVDGKAVRVTEGATILDACKRAGIETPTLCYGDTLTPVNVCRVCVVELEGARTLVPSCSRKVEEGMVVHTDSERVRTSRRLVMELLDSSVDLSLAPDAQRYLADYEADPARFGPDAATVAQEVKVDNDLYVRDYSKCILCYRCVEACGVDHQNTFAIHVAGRGFGAHISTELDVPLPDSACVYCGNCIAVCPTGALMFKSEHDLRAAGEWDEASQETVQTVCSYCGVGCNLELHVQDGDIVKVTSPDDHDVTRGNLCVKGRFGFQYVQNRD